MGWFRSEEMEYIKIHLHQDLAYRCLSQLGLVFDNDKSTKSLGVIQFKDLNGNMTALQRCQRHRIFEYYARELRRCDNLERMLEFFSLELSKAGIKPQTPVEPLERFLQDVSEAKGNLLDEVKDTMEGIEADLKEKNFSIAKLTHERNELMELAHVLEKELLFANDFDPATVAAGGAGGESKSDGVGLLQAAEAGGTDESIRFIRFIAGVIADEDKERFKRAAYRVTRGNFLPEFMEIEAPIFDPDTNKEVHKSVFVVIYQDDEIEAKLRRLCDAFGARTYDVPDLRDRPEINKQLVATRAEIRDKDALLAGLADKQREALHAHVAAYIVTWKWQIRREKSIFHTLNMFTPSSTTDSGGCMLIGEGWVLKEKADQCEHIIRLVGQQAQGATICNSFKVPPSEWPGSPPTYFRTNEFTGIYQAMVNTYGVPRYREVNPALSTVITFPFLFGTMYGDIGHGTVLFIASLFFIIKADYLRKSGMNEIVQMIFEGRYMLVLMGAFAIYMGFIYNDVFSLTLNAFGSKWNYTSPADATATAVFKVGSYENVYAFGMDPEWHNAENELAFYNSFKMKLSVIIGITQMFYGLIMRTSNAIFFREWIDLFFECIPMIVFMVSLFGYMIFLIFYKWCQPWDTQTPPSLINTMIAILLQPMCPDPTNPACSEGAVYAGQRGVQLILLLMAFVSVPVLLLMKPCLLGCCIPRCCSGKNKHGAAPPQGLMEGKSAAEYAEMGGVLDAESKGGDDVALQAPPPAAHGDDHEDHSFGNMMIHQAIETIEYVLGVVSNTASYLRLWALSLAHAELALVFWEKTMLMTIGMNWVEFQNKFYHGDGEAFKPFHFVAAVKGLD
eukprot:g1035.t1